MSNKLEIIFVILAIVQGFHCYSFGNVTAESKLIFQEYYNGTALPYEIVLRQVTVNTTEDIDAIRAVDVSGQNGTAQMNLYNLRSVQMVFSADAINRGFNFSLELYKNPATNFASKSFPMIWIMTLLIAGFCATRNL